VCLEHIYNKTLRDRSASNVNLENFLNNWQPPPMPPASIVLLANTLWRPQAQFAWTAYLVLIPPHLPPRVKHVHRIPSRLLATLPVSVFLDHQVEMVDHHARCVYLAKVNYNKASEKDVVLLN